MMNLQPECVLIVGRRGSGKSTKAKAMVNDPKRRAVVVFDPMAEYPLPQSRDLGHLKQQMRSQWQHGFKLSYVPEGGADMIKECHRLAMLVWQAQAPYETGRYRRQLTLVVDEANLAFPPTGLPRDQRGLQTCTLQGRHRGIGMICVTQRPSLVSKDYRGNCHRQIIFPLTNKDDQKAICDFIGDQFRPQIARQTDHHYLEWTPQAVQKGNNPPV